MGCFPRNGCEDGVGRAEGEGYAGGVGRRGPVYGEWVLWAVLWGCGAFSGRL